MFKKHIAFIIILIGLFSSAKSQIYTPYNLFSRNLFLHNPAHAGDKDQLSAFLIYRRHLSGFEGSPQNQALGLHLPVNKKMGLGGLLQSNQAGLMRTMNARLDYSYRTALAKKHFLGLGINGGYLTQLLIRDEIHAFDLNDPFIITDSQNRSIFFGGAGLEYRFSDFAIDFAVPFIYSSGNNVFSRYLTRLAYTFRTKSDIWEITPEVSGLYTSENQLHYRAALMLQYTDVMWIQAAYKENSSMIFAAGLRAGKIGISYSYDTNAGVLSSIGGPSHEISLSYGMFKKRNIDTLIFEKLTEKEKMLKQKINGTSYEKYVQANNYGFYNDVLLLTDSMHQEIKKQEKRDSIARVIAVKDSVKRLKKDTVNHIKTAEELTPSEHKILEKGVFFDMGSANINKKSQEYLIEVSKLLKANKRIKLLITGYTCDIGSKEINKIYAKDRADAVKYFLIHNTGLDPSRIVTETMGESDPIAPNTTEMNRKKNRRVLFSIVH